MARDSVFSGKKSGMPRKSKISDKPTNINFLGIRLIDTPTLSISSLESMNTLRATQAYFFSRIMGQDINLALHMTDLRNWVLRPFFGPPFLLI